MSSPIYKSNEMNDPPLLHFPFSKGMLPKRQYLFVIIMIIIQEVLLDIKSNQWH